MKNLTGSVVQALTKIYENNGTLPADMQGVVATLGAKDDAVGLPTAEGSWRFAKFTQDEYNALYAKLKDGSVVVSPSIDAVPAVEASTVDYQN